MVARLRASSKPWVAPPRCAAGGQLPDRQRPASFTTGLKMPVRGLRVVLDRPSRRGGRWVFGSEGGCARWERMTALKPLLLLVYIDERVLSLSVSSGDA
jgi:hypothetical protein